MHKRNLNHSELYLLTTTLYLSNTPPPPTPTMNIDQSRSCLICGTSVAVKEKQCGTSPLIFLLAESTQHISPIEQPIMPAYTTHGGQSFTLCCNLHIYLLHLTHTHAWRNFHLGQGEMSPPLFEIPFVSPHFTNMFIIIF